MLDGVPSQVRGQSIMNSDRFDAWTVVVASVSSRRAALRAAAAGAFAAALGTTRVRRVSAATDADQKCSQDSDCDSGVCFTAGKCKKNGKLTGKCRCGCDTDGDCPAGKDCCPLFPGVKRCLTGADQACKFDTDCCNALCQDGVCCKPAGGECGIVSSFCCSDNCVNGFCV
jgi:hypothetical protein